MLVAETINGTFLGAEVAANPRGSKNGPTVPEDLGIQAANVLMEEVYRVRRHGVHACVCVCVPMKY